jgi:hypothetical protein
MNLDTVEFIETVDRGLRTRSDAVQRPASTHSIKADVSEVNVTVH